MLNNCCTAADIARAQPILGPDRRQIRSEMAKIRRSWSPEERRWRQRLAQVSQWVLLSAEH